jgi:hypothetical protein
MVLRRPSYASVTSTLALFLALGGGAYAAATLPANSVGAKQIKKGAVERAKLKSNAVDGSKVLNNSLTGDDVKESDLGKVPAATTADNASHAAAAAALDKLTYRSVTVAALPTSDTFGTVGCDAGQHVVGGGVHGDDPSLLLTDDSYPDAGGTAWSAHVATGSSPTSFTVVAICASAATTG